MNKETIEEIMQSMFSSSLLTNETDVIQLHLNTIKSILEKHLLKEELKKKIELLPMTDKRYINENTYNLELNSNNIIENINRIVDFINNQ
jgi:hypothetical protein